MVKPGTPVETSVELEMPKNAVVLPKPQLTAFFVGTGLLAGLIAPPAAAEDIADKGPTISGILNATVQHATAQEAKDESNAQLVIESSLPLMDGSWNMEVKGGTTPKNQGVSAQVPEANGLVGETTDENGDGRFAVTQFYYRHGFLNGDAEGGILFPGRLIDTNAVADDETTQFLATPFINNSTLDMPVYNVGVDYQGKLSEQWGYTMLVSSTSDLEGGDHSYRQLFAVRAAGQGTFNAFELQWQAADMSGNVGIWNNTATHALLGASDGQQANYGLYTNIGGSRQALNWNFRAGLANQKVSESANFLGLNVNYVQSRVTLGAGLSRTAPSRNIPTATAATLASELYARVRIASGLYVSPDIQWIRHSNFAPDNTSTWVLGMRAGAEF